MLVLCGGARFVGYAAIRFAGCVYVTAAAHSWPFDADIDIVPDNSMLIAMRVKVATLVHKINRITQNVESVGKPFRNVELAVILRRQLHPRPLPERR